MTDNMSFVALSVLIEDACNLLDYIIGKIKNNECFTREQLEKIHAQSQISKQNWGPGLRHEIRGGFHKYF
jgi:hypothetical protein